VNSLRISIVQYLNTAPLVRGFTHGPLRGKYELSFTVPSKCAEALRTGSADVAIIPAIEYQRIGDLVVLPNLSIASEKSVRSLLLISRKPVEEVSSIALDSSSRSTQALVRILCAKLWGISPDFFEAAPDLRAMLKSADAALLIGDPALRLCVNFERGANWNAGHEQLRQEDWAGLPNASGLYIYDIVEKWRSLTGLPAVLAIWAARRNAVTPELILDFQQSLQFGMQQLDAISAEASHELNLPAEKLRSYLTANIDYTLDADNLQGLQRYFELAKELGLIARAKQLEFAGSTQTADAVSARRG
jgi:chorismate dehydratase